jgi:hypothetical protein
VEADTTEADLSVEWGRRREKGVNRQTQEASPINTSPQRCGTRERHVATSFKEYIVRHGHACRPSRTARQPIREDAADVRIIRSPGLDAASVALPAGIDLEDRAARMNEFWRALVDFQRRRTGRVRHDTHG